MEEQQRRPRVAEDEDQVLMMLECTRAFLSFRDMDWYVSQGSRPLSNGLCKKSELVRGLPAEVFTHWRKDECSWALWEHLTLHPDTASKVENVLLVNEKDLWWTLLKTVRTDPSNKTLDVTLEVEQIHPSDFADLSLKSHKTDFTHVMARVALVHAYLARYCGRKNSRFRGMTLTVRHPCSDRYYHSSTLLGVLRHPKTSRDVSFSAAIRRLVKAHIYWTCLQPIPFRLRNGKKRDRPSESWDSSPNMKFQPIFPFESMDHAFLESREQKARGKKELSLLPYCTTRVRDQLSREFRITSFSKPDVLLRRIGDVIPAHQCRVIEHLICSHRKSYRIADKNRVRQALQPARKTIDTAWLFVDFEVLLDPFRIYLIGVTEYREGKRVGYQAFWIKDLSELSQFKIIRQWMNYLSSSSFADYTLFYYFAEKMFLSRCCRMLRSRGFFITVPDEVWDRCIDIGRLIFYTPVFFRDAYNFKLKSIGASLQRYCPKAVQGVRFPSKLNDECGHSSSSIDLAYQLYRENPDVERAASLKDNLEQYNQFDCDLLAAITLFLYSKCSKNDGLS